MTTLGPTHGATTTADPAYGGRTTHGAHDGYSNADKHHNRPGFQRLDSQPGFPDYGDRRRIANPSPTGLFALAATTLMWSLFNARTRHIYQTNAVIGMALIVGGLCTLLAGMWEFRIGNTFGATASVLRAGGIIGCIASMFLFYSGAVGLHNRDTSYFQLPHVGLSKRRTDNAGTGAGTRDY
ncbi:hypothetical protein FRC07_000397 [Ceratobasidium sp. 392]|nr:hypothetical protein FRC07_000397 [Ceratobasidium sp. 392]